MRKLIYLMLILALTITVNAQENTAIIKKKREENSTIVNKKQDAKTEQKKESAAGLKIGAQIRPRTEYKHGYKSPTAKYLLPGYKMPSSIATSQRSRLNMFYKAKSIKFGLVLQDVRIWGSQPQLVSNDANDTYIHEAWGEVNLTNQISLKVGRMELVYDDHRILGNVGWAQQARSHDLALFKYKGVVEAHLGFAFHGNPYTGADAYKAMQFLWVHGKAGDLAYSFLALNNGKAERQYHYSLATTVSERNAYSQIIGGRVTYKIGDLNFALNAYYQMGKNPADWVNKDSIPGGDINAFNTANGKNFKGAKSEGQKISAYNIAIDAMYKLNSNLKLGVGYEMLSGNDFTNTNRKNQNAFTPLYGTNHKFNGWMDYFYVGNHVGSVGLQDINLKFIYTYGKFFAKIIPHYFLPAGKAKYTFTDKSGNTSQKDLGSLGLEIDTWFGYKIVPKVASIQFGYSQMLATESMYALKSGAMAYSEGFQTGSNNWAWVMLNITPSMLFK